MLILPKLSQNQEEQNKTEYSFLSRPVRFFSKINPLFSDFPLLLGFAVQHCLTVFQGAPEIKQRQDQTDHDINKAQYRDP